MGKKIIITENQHKLLQNYLLENNLSIKVIEQMKSELDTNYEPMIGVIRKGGEYNEKPMFKIKADGETISAKDLYDYLSFKYKYNPEFIKQVINDWAFGRIEDNRLTKNVSLT